jgi:hypothetical protein
MAGVVSRDVMWGNKQPGFPFLQRTTLRRDVVLLIPTSDIEIWIVNLRIVATESK